MLDQVNAPFGETQKLKAIHKGMEDGGISGILQSRIHTPPNNTMTRQEIILELRSTYTDPSLPQFNNMWLPARDWLRKMQQSGHLEAGLVIPD